MFSVVKLHLQLCLYLGVFFMTVFTKLFEIMLTVLRYDYDAGFVGC